MIVVMIMTVRVSRSACLVLLLRLGDMLAKVRLAVAMFVPAVNIMMDSSVTVPVSVAMCIIAVIIMDPIVGICIVAMPVSMVMRMASSVCMAMLMRVSRPAAGGGGFFWNGRSRSFREDRSAVGLQYFAHLVHRHAFIHDEARG